MILIRDNVERIVESDAKIAKLKKEGFKELCEPEVLADQPIEKPSLEDMKVDDLKALAKEKGLEGYSSLSKNELLAVLKDVI